MEDNKELIKYLNGAFDNVQEQFSSLNVKVDDRVGGVEDKMGQIEKDVVSIKSQMVTKGYLDDKLADLSGDLIVKLRKEDAKVDRLIEILNSKSVLSKADLKEMACFQIFPKASR